MVRLGEHSTNTAHIIVTTTLCKWTHVSKEREAERGMDQWKKWKDKRANLWCYVSLPAPHSLRSSVLISQCNNRCNKLISPHLCSQQQTDQQIKKIKSLFLPRLQLITIATQYYQRKKSQSRTAECRDYMFWLPGCDVRPLPSHCLPRSLSLTHSVTKETASMAEWGWFACISLTTSTTRLMQCSHLFTFWCLITVALVAPVSPAGSLKIYKLIISTSSACSLFCKV